jgi:hypothetical protein
MGNSYNQETEIDPLFHGHERDFWSSRTFERSFSTNRTIWGSSSLLSICKLITMVEFSLNDLRQTTLSHWTMKWLPLTFFWFLQNHLDTAYHTITITRKFSL